MTCDRRNQIVRWCQGMDRKLRPGHPDHVFVFRFHEANVVSDPNHPHLIVTSVEDADRAILEAAAPSDPNTAPPGHGSAGGFSAVGMAV